MGAGDPTSGTVSLNEVVRGLGALYEKGWRPLRTILIASWDGEEVFSFCSVSSDSSTILSAYSTALSGARNGEKISPIGFKSTLLLTLTSVKKEILP